MNYDELRELLDKALRCNLVSNYPEAELALGQILNATESADEGNSVERLADLQAQAFLQLADIDRKRGDFEGSLKHANDALALCDRFESDFVRAKAWGLNGVAYRNLGSYDKANDFFQNSLDTFIKLGSKVEIGITCGNLGNLQYSLGAFDRALDYFSRSLAIADELGDKRRVAGLTMNIGIVQQELGSFETALENFSSALAGLNELGDKNSAAQVIVNQGNVYQKLERYDEALECYAKAIQFHEEHGEKSSVSTVQINKGNTFMKLGHLDDAMEQYRQALATAQNQHDRAVIAMLTGNIGSLLAMKEYSGYDPTAAEESLLRAVGMCTDLGAKMNLYQNLKNLSKLYANEERWKDAFDQVTRYIELRDEVKSEEAKHQADFLAYRRKIEESERDRQLNIARHEVTTNLLHKTLPPSIAERLMNGEHNIADRFESVTILFADIVGFTPLSETITPKQLIELLNNLFSRFDTITQQFGVERLKTIGDAYMVVSGAPERCDDHALRMAQVAIAMLDQARALNQEINRNIQIRIGISSGEAIGAIVGVTKFSYDLWSDAVNTASRMESHGEASRIHVSSDFRNALNGDGQKHFRFQDRGQIDIKGKGLMRTYFLEKA